MADPLDGPRDHLSFGRRAAVSHRLRLGFRLALVCALALMLAPGEASAAALRGPAAALGALAFVTALLFIREWPGALTGSIWVTGTLFAAAFWLLRSRYRPQWFASPAAARAATLQRTAPLPTIVAPARDAAAVPPDEPEAVIAAARRCFVALQAAWDAGDVEAMALHTSAEMLDELLQELPQRGPGPNRTDVVTLDATLLVLEELGGCCVASVEFSGMIRESSERGAAPFKEVWMLTCPKGQSNAWRLARHQALL
jgi:hypothetical protein